MRKPFSTPFMYADVAILYVLEMTISPVFLSMACESYSLDLLSLDS